MFTSHNRNGSVKVDFEVKYKSKTPTTKIRYVQVVIETLQRETKDKLLGKLAILPQNFKIKGNVLRYIFCLNNCSRGSV